MNVSACALLDLLHVHHRVYTSLVPRHTCGTRFACGPGNEAKFIHHKFEVNNVDGCVPNLNQFNTYEMTGLSFITVFTPGLCYMEATAVDNNNNSFL